MQTNTYKIDIADVKLTVSFNSASIGIDRSQHAVGEIEGSYQTHAHSNYEIMIVTSGELVINTTDKKWVCRNGIAIIPPSLYHFCNFNNVTVTCFNFSIERIEKKRGRIFDIVNDAIENSVAVLHLDEIELAYVKELVAGTTNNIAYDAIPHLLSLLFARIFSGFASASPEKTEPIRENYTTVIECYLTQNIDKKITLGILSEELHVCTKQVSRIIEKEYGCTLAELLNRHRTSVAAMLLHNTKLSEKEIAYSTGYATEKTFKKHFKERFGTSPAEYRIEFSNGAKVELKAFE